MSDSVPPAAISVYDHLAMIMQSLAELAWVKMGLHPDFATGNIETPDLAQAKVAIDTATYIGTQIEGQLDDGDRREVQNMLRDLKMNYVQRSGG